MVTRSGDNINACKKKNTLASSLDMNTTTNDVYKSMTVINKNRKIKLK